MGSTYSYDREGFLSEFFPEIGDRSEVEAGAQALINSLSGSAHTEIGTDAAPGGGADERASRTSSAIERQD